MMKKRTNIILGISVAVITAFIFMIVNGLHLMEIEDHYGDLQTIYFRSENGDIIVDSNKRVGLIMKVANKIYVDENGCMRDLYNWVNTNQQPVKFSIYRPELSETLTDFLTYKDVERLINKQQVEPIISN